MNTMRIPANARSIVTMLLVTAGAAAAQGTLEGADRPSIRVTGEATITAEPDRARIDVGVVTQADTAQAASARNAGQLDRVLTALRMLLGPNADISTTGYSLTPDYRYPREGGRPSISGYTATTVVQVTITDLSQVGRVIDLVTPTGANRINRLQFMLEDETTVRAQALRQAARQAKAEVDVLADALGVKIARVLLVQEGGTAIPRPVSDYRTAELASATPTPIEPGTIEVRATVTLTVEIAQ